MGGEVLHGVDLVFDFEVGHFVVQRTHDVGNFFHGRSHLGEVDDLHVDRIDRALKGETFLGGAERNENRPVVAPKRIAPTHLGFVITQNTDDGERFVFDANARADDRLARLVEVFRHIEADHADRGDEIDIEIGDEPPFAHFVGFDVS